MKLELFVKVILLLAGGASITGCATKYVPATNDGARIRFVVSPQTLLAQAAYSEKQCFSPDDDPDIQAVAVLGPKTVSGLRLSPGARVGIPYDTYRPELSTETYIRTDKEVTLGYSAIIAESVSAGTRYTTKCSAGVTFLPARGQDYQLDFDHDGQGCYVALRRLDKDAGRWVNLSADERVRAAPKCPS